MFRRKEKAKPIDGARVTSGPKSDASCLASPGTTSSSSSDSGDEGFTGSNPYAKAGALEDLRRSVRSPSGTVRDPEQDLQLKSPASAIRRASLVLEDKRKAAWAQTLERLEQLLSDPSMPWLTAKPFLIRECHAVQLAEAYRDPQTSTVVRDRIQRTAVQLIEQLAQIQVITKQQFADVLPIALIPNPAITTQLLNTLTVHLRQQAILDAHLLMAVTQTVRYGQQQLSTQAVLSVLEIITDRLKGLHAQTGVELHQGLSSLNALLDAALTIHTHDLSAEQLATVKENLAVLQPTDPTDQVALAYARQALERMTQQPTQFEQAMAVSYHVALGLVKAGCAVVEMAPSFLIDGARDMLTAGRQATRMATSPIKPWFAVARTLKLLARHDFKKFTAYLDALTSATEQTRGLFGIRSKASVTLPSELVILLIPILDERICDRTAEREDRKRALTLLSDFYRSETRYGSHPAMRESVLVHLYGYCSLPEPALQAVAKQQATQLFQQSPRIPAAATDNTQPQHYWPTELAIQTQGVNSHFAYGESPFDAPRHEAVAAALRVADPLLYALERMHAASHQRARELGNELKTYVPLDVSADAGKTRQEFATAVLEFLRGEVQAGLFLGGPGSGKSLMLRYLALALWHLHQQGEACMPVLITLSTADGSSALLQQIGLPPDQVQQLCQQYNPVVLADGFDEMRQASNLLPLVPATSKLLVTSRTDAFRGDDSYGYFHAANEFVISPFSAAQRVTFFQRLHTAGLSAWRVEQYETAIRETKGLAVLITTPYLLRMVAQVLPGILANRGGFEATDVEFDPVSRAQVYRAFTTLNFERAQQRFEAQASQPNSRLQPPEGFIPVRSFETFSMELAAMFYVNGLTSVFTTAGNHALSTERVQEWDRLFESREQVTRCARYGAPIQQIGERTFAFEHKSLQEYFAARMLVAEIRQATQGQWDLIRYFNRRPISEEPSVLAFLIDLLREQPQLSRALSAIITQAKSDPALALAAGNAISLLTACGYGFAEQDLSQVTTEAAVLNGDFTGAQFRQATMPATSFDGAQLDGADFSAAHLANSQATECAALAGRAGTIFTFATLTQANQLIAATRSGATVWDLATGQQIAHLPALTEWQTSGQSPAGRWFACADKTNLYLWDSAANTWQRIGTAGAKSVALSDEDLVWISAETDQPAAAADKTLTTLTIQRISLTEPGNVIDVACPQRSQAQQLHHLSYDASTNCWYLSWQCMRNWPTLSKISALDLQIAAAAKASWLDRRIDAAKTWSIGANHLLLLSQQQQFSCVDRRELQPVSLTGLRRASDCCVSASGEYLLTQQAETITVYKVVWHDEAEVSMTCHPLYHVDAVTGVLNTSQFSSDDSMLAFACGTTIEIRKATDGTRLQLIALEGQRAEAVRFVTDDTSVVAQLSNAWDLPRFRVQPKPELEQHLREGTATAAPPALSAFGAKFYDVQGLTSELKALLAERGALLVSEVALIADYKAVRVALKQLHEAKQAAATADDQAAGKQAQQQYVALTEQAHGLVALALRYRYLKFCQTMRWNPAASAYLPALLRQQPRDGVFDTFLLALAEAGKLPPVDQADELGMTALHVLAHRGHLRSLRRLIELGATPTSETTRGETALLLAARNGHAWLCQQLLVQVQLQGVAELQTYLNQADADGWTALTAAAREGHTAVCRALLDAGAAVNQRGPDGRTSLHFAADHGHLALAELLLARDADTTLTYKFDWTPLFLAAIKGHADVCAPLLDAGDEQTLLTEQRRDGFTLLHAAALNGRLKVCQLLLERGTSINNIRSNGVTPLADAAQHDQAEICELLLAQDGGKAALTIADVEESLPLHLAAASGAEAACQVLIAQGAAVNRVETNTKLGALHLAARSGYDAVCLLLLRSGADQDCGHLDQGTPLIWAAFNGHVSTCRILLENGAKRDATDRNGCNALIMAAKHGHELACRLLREHGATVAPEFVAVMRKKQLHELVRLVTLPVAVELEQKQQSQRATSTSIEPVAESARDRELSEVIDGIQAIPLGSVGPDEEDRYSDISDSDSLATVTEHQVEPAGGSTKLVVNIMAMISTLHDHSEAYLAELVGQQPKVLSCLAQTKQTSGSLFHQDADVDGRLADAKLPAFYQRVTPTN